MTIDPNTGLPELPAGHFWRVRQKHNMFAGELVVVQLRRKIWVFSYEMKERFGNPDDWSTIEAAVLYMAKDMIKQFEKERRDLGFSRVVGDYPPKKLG